MEETRYGIRTTIPGSFEHALSATRAALQAEGFGVLTEIDIQEKLKEKLGVDFQRYIILGACNPPLAHRALLAERDIGLLLPCNVIVYENGPHECVVAAADPNTMVEMAGDSVELRAVAKEARTRLMRAIENVATVNV